MKLRPNHSLWLLWEICSVALSQEESVGVLAMFIDPGPVWLCMPVDRCSDIIPDRLSDVVRFSCGVYSSPLAWYTLGNIGWLEGVSRMSSSILGSGLFGFEQ